MIQPKPEMRTGDYLILRGRDTPEERADAERIMRNNGCRTVRYEPLQDGRLQIHGYVGHYEFG